MADDKAPERLVAEFGRSGLKSIGGYIQEEFDPDLRGLNGIRIFEEMRKNDSTIAAGLRAISWTLGQVQWRIEPGGDTAPDKAAAEWLDTCRHDMSITWTKFLRDALTCLAFGFAFLEIVYKQRAGGETSRYDDGRIGWQRINLIGQDSLRMWQMDDNGNAEAFIQAGDILGSRYVPDTPIPLDKGILFRLDDEKDNPEGVSLLRSSYLPWYMRKNMQEIEAIGIERDLTGVLIIHLPVSATATDKSKAVNLLEQFKADDMAGFVAPQFGAGEHERWRFEIINSPGNKTIDSDKVIQRYQLEMARNFLAQFLMLGQGATGSWALGRDQRDMFEVALGAILQNVEETLNRFLLPPIFRLNNFGKLTALPQMRAGRVSKSDIEKFSVGMKNLQESGLITPHRELEEFIREEFELPVLPEEARLETPAEKPEEPPEEDTGQGDKQARELDEEDLGRVPQLPDPDDDDAWKMVEQESNERLRKHGFNVLSETLQFARPFDYAAKLEKMTAEYRDKMADLAERLRNKEIEFGKWSYDSRVHILRYTQDGYRLGVAEALGIPPSKVKLTQEQRREANAAVAEQYKYFAEFAKDVKARQKAGDLTTYVDSRSNLYGGSLKSAFQRARLKEQGEKQLRWKRHKSDSCPTCLENEGKVKKASEWYGGAVWPSHGTKCDGNCGCNLDAV